MRYERGTAVLGGVAAAVLLVGPEIAAADNWRFPAGWNLAVPEVAVNTGSAEGCPIETPDGRSLIIASNRRGLSGNDIWAADRSSIDAPFGEPRRIEGPISLDTSAEFCPFPTAGRVLFFVSTRAGACGGSGGDIYYARQSPVGDWSDPVNLGCAPNGPNTDDTEFSPSLVETWYGTFLFFSTAASTGDQNIYVSVLGSDGTFGPGRIVSSLSSPAADFMPNVRPRDHGGFEVVFNSNRETWGRNNAPAFGGQDVYTATAWRLPDAWTTPTNVGPNVNTAGNETRATLSGDGERLHFGRDGDIYVSERNH